MMDNNDRICKVCKRPLPECEDNDLCQACRSKRGEKYKGKLIKGAVIVGAGYVIIKGGKFALEVGIKGGKLALKAGKYVLDRFKK